MGPRPGHGAGSHGTFAAGPATGIHDGDEPAERDAREGAGGAGAPRAGVPLYTGPEAGEDAQVAGERHRRSGVRRLGQRPGGAPAAGGESVEGGTGGDTE